MLWQMWEPMLYSVSSLSGSDGPSPTGSGGNMQLPQDGALLRIFIGEADKYMGQPLYEWLVLQALEQGLAGATVLRGMMGFGGGTRRIQKFRIESLAEDL